MVEPTMHDAAAKMVSCMIRQESPPGNLARAEHANRVAELLVRFG